MTQLFKNAARSALVSAIISTDTALTVNITVADLFPVANTGTSSIPTVGLDWFKIVLEDTSHNFEIVYARTRALGSAVMSNLLRGQEGTTALSFASGSIVGLRMTALDMQAAIDLASSTTGSGAAVKANSPTLVTPNLGTPSTLVGTNITGTAAGLTAGNATNADYGSGIIAGTVMTFQQTAAPTGWTKNTTHDNKALRVVSGAASSGGSVAFTTAFASQGVAGTVGNTTLDITQIPAHTHPSHSTSGPGGSYDYPGWGGTNMYLHDSATDSAGGGGAHAHSFSGTAINLAVQYVDLILASKD